jgi:hypothetical protein
VGGGYVGWGDNSPDSKKESSKSVFSLSSSTSALSKVQDPKRLKRYINRLKDMHFFLTKQLAPEGSTYR